MKLIGSEIVRVPEMPGDLLGLIQRQAGPHNGAVELDQRVEGMPDSFGRRHGYYLFDCDPGSVFGWQLCASQPGQNPLFFKTER